MAGSGCENAEKVKQVEIISCYMNCYIENNVLILLLITYQILLEVDGDVDAAIEFLIAEQKTDSFSEENNSPCYDTNISYGKVFSLFLLHVK